MKDAGEARGREGMNERHVGVDEGWLGVDGVAQCPCRG